MSKKLVDRLKSLGVGDTMTYRKRMIVCVKSRGDCAHGSCIFYNKSRQICKKYPDICDRVSDDKRFFIAFQPVDGYLGE